jgi:hypothetical protein
MVHRKITGGETGTPSGRMYDAKDQVDYPQRDLPRTMWNFKPIIA